MVEVGVRESKITLPRTVMRLPNDARRVKTRPPTKQVSINPPSARSTTSTPFYLVALDKIRHLA